MITKPKPVEQRDTLDLLELVCQLHSRSLNQPRNKEMHDAYTEARKEIERRIKVNNNFVLSDATLAFSDIRNKLSPIKNLIAMLQNGLVKGKVEMHELVLKEIEACKESIVYLSGNEIANNTTNERKN